MKVYIVLKDAPRTHCSLDKAMEIKTKFPRSKGRSLKRSGLRGKRRGKKKKQNPTKPSYFLTEKVPLGVGMRHAVFEKVLGCGASALGCAISGADG